MSTLVTTRLAVLSVVSLFGLILAGVSGHFISLTSGGGFYFSFAALSLATSILTVLTVPTMIVLDNIAPGGLTSFIAVEVSWLGFLGILWISSAGSTTSATFGYTGSCSSISKTATTVCNEIKILQALGYLNWLALWGYVVALIIFTIMASNRGHAGVWTHSVKDIDLNAAKNPAAMMPQGVPQVYAAPYVQPMPTGNTVQSTPTGMVPPLPNMAQSTPTGMVQPLPNMGQQPIPNMAQPNYPQMNQPHYSQV